MKKFWDLLLVTVVVLVGCGRPSIEKILTEGDGKWIFEGFSKSTEVEFFNDGEFNLQENGRNYAGSFEYDRKNKKISTMSGKLYLQI